MLKLQHAPTFPVKVAVPVPGGEPVSITVTCRHMGRGELLAHMQEAQREARPPLYRRLLHPWWPWPVKTDAQRLMQIVVGWGDEVDTPFSPDAVERLCELYPIAAPLIVEAWARTLTELRAGN